MVINSERLLGNAIANVTIDNGHIVYILHDMILLSDVTYRASVVVMGPDFGGKMPHGKGRRTTLCNLWEKRNPKKKKRGREGFFRVRMDPDKVKDQCGRTHGGKEDSMEKLLFFLLA